MIAHCTASPSIFIGTPKEKAGPAADRKSEVRAPLSWAEIGPCTVVNEGPDTIVLYFSLPFVIRISYIERVLRINFSSADSGRKSLRMFFGANPREKLFGAGPSVFYNLKTKEIEIGSESTADFGGREPAIFSNSGTWMYVDGSGILRWSFDPSRTVLFCSAVPKEIAIGFGKTQAMAMELLSNYRASRQQAGKARAGLRNPLPKQLQSGVIIDASEAPQKALASIKAIRDVGVAPAWLVGRTIEGETDLPALSADEWKEILDFSSACSLSAAERSQKGAKELVRRILSLSFSGNGHTFLPIGKPGGDAADPSSALDIPRLLDLAMFSPLFVVDSGMELAGSALLHAFSRAAAVYGALMPYRDFCSEWWVREGIPAFYHLALYYPDETALWKIDDQYMFGPDLMIAPVFSGGRESRRLCLPDDAWIHMWTSRHYSGGAAVIDAPAGKPAVFYREDSSFARLFDTVRQMATRL